MRIHQFVHTLNYGDAISGEAIAIQRLLRERGMQSEIYALHAHEKVAEYVRDWETARTDLAGQGEDTAVILHYSIGSPLNTLFGELANVKRAIIYHNLTPDRWFEGYNTRVLKDLQAGRKELPGLLKQADLVIADSDYNRRELIAFGCPDATVLPLLFDPERWTESANSGIRRALSAHGGVNLLHVGRMAPNKCVEDVIKAFYFYHHKINRESRLWLVGIDIDTEIYSFELRRLVSRLRLNEAVNFVGGVADSELRAFYEGADLYLCMSEHEGFCLPLVEAMNFGIPIIAYDAGAVAETLDNAGFLLKSKEPGELAELIHIAITDMDVRSELIRRGQQRVEAFRLQEFSQNLVERLLDKIFAPPARAQGVATANE